MPVRQSDFLLAKVRESAQKRGWNTAALAQEMGADRKRIRAVLAGREPLTVDDFARMVEVLQISPEDLALAAAAMEKAEAVDETASPEPQPGNLRVLGGAAAVADDEDWSVDPDGPHAEQLFRMGFGLGVDFLFLSEVARLKDSGVPASVLARFPERIPIKLDAAYHRHNRPRFLPEGIELRLSFDAVYTCLFPWDAIVQVTFFPEAPPVEEAPTPGRPTLTLVRS